MYLPSSKLDSLCRLLPSLPASPLQHLRIHSIHTTCLSSTCCLQAILLLPQVHQTACSKYGVAAMAPKSLFIRALVVLSSIVAPIFAQTVAFTNSDYTITAGSPFLLTWNGDGTVSCLLHLNPHCAVSPMNWNADTYPKCSLRP